MTSISKYIKPEIESTTETMFRQFYKDIDRLHEAVKPFRYYVYTNRMNDALTNYKEQFGRLVVETLEAATATKSFLKAAKDYPTK